jgi:hypothetical protein
MAYTPKPEHALQASVAAFFKSWLPADMPWSSVDHGITFKGDALQRANQWNRLAARGVKKGLHDMPIIFYRGHLHSIELKRPGQDADDEQRAWGAKIVAQGGTWDVCSTRAEVWASMCRAFPHDNPLKPPPALLQMWLAKDDVPAKPKPLSKARNPRIAKPKATRGQIERGNRWSLALARGPR